MDLGFLRGGIRYEELSEEDKDTWDELEWGEDEDGLPLAPPDEVEAGALNRLLFNADTVDKVLERLMRDGITVAGGDRLGKTIIFAKNQPHGESIAERFDHHYPHHAGHLARVITHDISYAQDLIEDFSDPAKAPDIAISVGMLDTGVDVPDVVNLVFFKLVRILDEQSVWGSSGPRSSLSTPTSRTASAATARSPCPGPVAARETSTSSSARRPSRSSRTTSSSTSSPTAASSRTPTPAWPPKDPRTCSPTTTSTGSSTPSPGSRHPTWARRCTDRGRGTASPTGAPMGAPCEVTSRR